MKKAPYIVGAGLIASAALLMCSASAMAHGRVDWSISVGVPAYYPWPVVYYDQPQVVYVRPQPVYQVPAPIVEYRERPYYAYHGPYWREHGWRDHEWHEQHHRYQHDHD